jgi:hypothetical protein
MDLKYIVGSFSLSELPDRFNGYFSAFGHPIK